ncbi:unnamed protein product [Cylicostephanus goldi]|uniref:Uncharacterized protein n=1 Tax=Cylicostephanus goldi TaxID=71465 RepID=A0A3P6QK52_CYLGO|nr:unnamed protein product [Cylicostephanus goldi]
MQYKQIGAVVNEIFSEIIGESELVNEDLSNIVEVGKVITSSTTFDENYENYTRKIIDKVGKTIFHEDSNSKEHLPIYKDSWEYGSILEKIRVEAPDAEEDYTFDLENYTPDDIFTFEGAEASEKFYNNSTTFKIKVSLPKRQLRSAFTSPSLMSRFISAIENRIRFKMNVYQSSLEYRTECNLIAEKFKSGNDSSLVNLFACYVDETGDTTLTADKALKDANFLRFCNMKIGMLRDFIKKESMLYGDGGYTNVTNESQQVMIMLTDFDKALNTYLYSDTRHTDYVKLSGYSVVPHWQAGGTKNAYIDRSTINVIPASEGRKPKSGEDTRRKIVQSGILGVLQDERSCAVTCEHDEVESIKIPDARFVNYWYFRDANYLTDTDENVIVFYIDNYRPVGRFAEEPADWDTVDYYERNANGGYSIATEFDENTSYYTKVRA